VSFAVPCRQWFTWKSRPKLFFVNYSHAGIVFTEWSKNGFFAPQRRHVPPINVKFGTGERTTGPLPMPNYKFAPHWETGLHYFYEILSVCTRL